MGFSSCILHSWGSQALTRCYLFPPLERLSQLDRSTLGGCGPGEVSLTAASVVTKFLLFVFVLLLRWHAGISPREIWTSTHFLSCLYICPGQHSLGFLPATVRGVWAGLLAPLVPLPIASSVCLSLDVQVGETPPGSRGVWC